MRRGVFKQYSTTLSIYKYSQIFKLIINSITALDWFREDKPLRPDEAREGMVKYPWGTRLEPVRLGLVDYGELALRLSFVVDKKRSGAPLIGTPGNYKRPIPRQDAELIINNLK
jgi:hypothetical protein